MLPQSPKYIEKCLEIQDFMSKQEQIKKTEVAVAWRKNAKIAIPALTPNLNLTQTLSLALNLMLNPNQCSL